MLLNHIITHLNKIRGYASSHFIDLAMLRNRIAVLAAVETPYSLIQTLFKNLRLVQHSNIKWNALHRF
jgi:hypothetical protein